MTNLEIYDELELLSPPADTINDTLAIMGINTYSFADQMEIPLNEAVQLIDTAYPITEHIAEKLERVLKIECAFWLNRERDYREKLNFLKQELVKNAKNNQ